MLHRALAEGFQSAAQLADLGRFDLRASIDRMVLEQRLELGVELDVEPRPRWNQ